MCGRILDAVQLVSACLPLRELNGCVVCGGREIGDVDGRRDPGWGWKESVQWMFDKPG